MVLHDELSFYGAIRSILRYLEVEEFDIEYAQREFEKMVRIAYFSGYIDKEHMLRPRFPRPKGVQIRPCKS